MHIVQKKFHFILIFLLTAITFFLHSSIFLGTDSVQYYATRYSKSQYILGDASPDKVPDYVVYIYAGHNYIKGQDPTTINFEHPPLGKYILGLSYLLFNNSIVINIPIFFLCFYLFYSLLGKVTKSEPLKIFALIALFSTQIMTTYSSFGLLDLQQLLYTLLFFTTLFWETKKKRTKYLLLGLFLGMIASVKYPIIILPLFLPIIFYFAFRQKELKFLLFTLFSTLAFYLLTYSVYFFHGHNLVDFIKFEWYRFRWWTGERTIPKFLLLQTIFTGRFKGWWDKDVYEYATSWNLSWPLICLFGVFSTVFVKKNLKLLIYGYYSLGLFLMYVFGSGSNERYLIQLFPFWLIMIVAFIQSRQSAK